MRSREEVLIFLMMLAVTSLVMTTKLASQTLTTGDIVGRVTDSSGAVVPDVTVILKSDEKGFTQTGVSNMQGTYRFALLLPGTYSVSASASGFANTTRAVTVSASQIASLDLVVPVGPAHTTIEVPSEPPLLQKQNADLAATFNTLQVAEVPNPGNDLTNVVQSAPGTVMNTQNGNGNFSTYGLPAISNLFTLDGMYDNDPFGNTNNAGATNLLLGSNEIQEVTVVNNGYSGQYGGFAGAYVNYVSKSGTNNFHGNAVYWWNGRVMNANDWFNKDFPPGIPPTPRPFVNANQYAISLGGPIKRNKAFFYTDYEGLRLVLPTTTLTLIPSPQFEAATLANLSATGHTASIPFYRQMFNLWNGAPGANRATGGNPQTGDPTGCNGFTGSGGLGSSIPCALSFRSTAGNFTHEYLLGGRFDFNISPNDKLFVRLREDQGLQASYTDPINPIFDIQSNQPIYQGQVSENHLFTNRAVNQLIFSSSNASFLFQPKSLPATLAAFPTTVVVSDGTFSNLGGVDFTVPAGHSFTHYQVTDDFFLMLGGGHNLKFGLNFRRYDVSNHDYGSLVSGEVIPFTVADFFAGGVGPVGDELLQSFPSSQVQHLALYGLGFYGQDEWHVTQTLSLTLTLRADYNSNPACRRNCFARFARSFNQLNHDVNTPYNQAIRIRLKRALPSFAYVVWQPRFGFTWTPLHLKGTVLSGGFGLFMDTLPGILAEFFSSNTPLVNSFNILSDNLAPTEPSNLFKDAASANAALLSGFAKGGTLASITASDPFFAPPNFTNAIGMEAPRYQEWNFEMQQALGLNTSVALNYVGNHGIHIPVFFSGVNAYCPPSVCPAGFGGLPRSAPDPRFSVVTEVRGVGASNYNGLAASFQHRFTKGFQLRANYTWSHALDEISNGGFFPGFNGATAFGLGSPEDNSNLRKYNYGNADYDTRQYLSGSYLWDLPHEFGPAALLKGWQVSGTIFRRTGFPYTVVDSRSTSVLSQFGYSGNVYADFLGAAHTPCNTPKHACLEESQFSSPIEQMPAGFGAQRRNQFYGPGFFNVDFAVAKSIRIPGWEQGQLRVGAQFFNLFNHPNFDQPNRDIGDPSLFGHITKTVSPPTSILGSGLGGDASPRLIELTVRINF
jgi:hypothetical protein